MPDQIQRKASLTSRPPHVFEVYMVGSLLDQLFSFSTSSITSELPWRRRVSLHTLVTYANTYVISVFDNATLVFSRYVLVAI